MTYSEKLKDPRWQKRRLEILSRDNFECTNCKSGLNDGQTLHVHHMQYSGEPWDAPDHFLTTLCEYCHNVESIDRPLEEKRLLKELKFYKVHSVTSLIDGLKSFRETGLQPYDLMMIYWAMGSTETISAIRCLYDEAISKIEPLPF